MWCKLVKMAKCQQYYAIAVYPQEGNLQESYKTCHALEFEYWTVKKRHIQNMCVAEMSLLRWMSDNTIKDRKE